jgi:hypothetical protein
MSDFHAFCKEEAELYQEIIALLEWKVKKPHNQLYNDFFPVMVSGKGLVKLDPAVTRLDYKKFITFKPLKNNKHCQFLVELLYEEENVQDLITYGRDSNGKYSAKVVDHDNMIMQEVAGCDTETEAKFCVIYEYFLEEGIMEKIKPIKEFDEKHKKPEPVRSKNLKGTTTHKFSDGNQPVSGLQQNKLEFVKKHLGKKFSGQTSKGAYNFLAKWYDEAVDVSKKRKGK